MSCVNCGTGLCGCGIMYNAQQNRMAQAQLNQGAAGINYQMAQQAQLNNQWGIPIVDMHDYAMFKKYAHLTEQEIVDVYLAERTTMEDQIKSMIDALNHKLESQLETQEKEFWVWMAKYRRNLTKERLEKYFLALL